MTRLRLASPLPARLEATEASRLEATEALRLEATEASRLEVTEASRLESTEAPRPESLRPAHIPALDGLRGVAVLSVMLFHATMRFEASSPAGAGLLRVLGAGWCGVDLFFVLSGFLITGILIDARGSSHALRNFYIRRILRIFPLYYGVLLVIFGLLPRLGLFDTPELRHVAELQGWLWAYATNIAMLVQGDMVFQAGWLSLNHFWSLAVEEHFYLVWPVLVLWLERRTLMWLCLGIVGLVPFLRLGLTLAGATWVAAYTLTPCRVDALALGGLLALAARSDGGLVRWLEPARRLAWLSGGLLVAIFLWRGELIMWDRLIATAGYSLLGVFFGALLVQAVVPAGRAWQRLLERPGLRAFGQYSYALYVFHGLLRSSIDERFSAEGLAGVLGSTAAGNVAAVVVSIGSCFGMAWLSWHLFEKRVLRLKRLFP